MSAEEEQTIKKTMAALTAKERRGMFKSEIIVVKDYRKQAQKKKKKLNLKAIDQINNTLSEERSFVAPISCDDDTNPPNHLVNRASVVIQSGNDHNR